MNKNGPKTTRYAINWATHPKNLMKNFCSLMEHQSLVDVVICCGNSTIQAHKFVLAANSPLFREEFEKNPLIEQIMVAGCDFTVLKSVVEMMYCGQTIIAEENVKFLLAIVKLFQMQHLENLFSNHTSPAEDVYLPKPVFLTKKPKYPAFTFPPQNNVANVIQQQPSSVAQLPANANILKPLDFNVGPRTFGRGKRTLKQQAEQACVKEAQASRMALASLQKEIAAAPQVNSFVIEDTCTETTVENFIPHTEPTPYALNYDILGDSLQNAIFMPSHNNNPSIFSNYPKPPAPPREKRTLTADKLKYILGAAQVPSNVEIMYKDAEGNFVPVNEEVLQNLSTKEGLQYQVVDEDGRVSEMQELQVIDKIMESSGQMIDIAKPVLEVGDILKDSEGTLCIKDGLCSLISKTGHETPIPAPMNQVLSNMDALTKSSPEMDLKFSPDIFFTIEQNEVTVVEDDLFSSHSHKIEKTEN